VAATNRIMGEADPTARIMCSFFGSWPQVL
jgi:hypothetical protein